TSVPQLLVSDITETMEYLTEKLGFGSYGYTWYHHRRAYCNAFREQVFIDLWQSREPIKINRRRTLSPAMEIDLEIWVKSIRSYYSKVRKRGAKILRSISRLPSGHLSFVVEIPDRYRIRFITQEDKRPATLPIVAKKRMHSK